MKKKYIFEVAPLTVLPFRKSVFTYTYAKNLAPGTIVSIPFSGRILTGIVLSALTASKHEAKLKDILSALDRPALTKEQLALATAVSNTTYTGLGKVLKHFTPKKAKARKDRKPSAQKNILPFTVQESEETQVTKALLVLKKSQKLFFSLSSHQKSLHTLLVLVRALQKKGGGQILVLVPDIAAAVRIERDWQNYSLNTEIVSLYHTKTPGLYYEAWEQIQSGRTKIIIATRGGLFAPFQNLSFVLQLDPNDDGYKQWDMSPRYQSSTALPFLLSLHNASFIELAPQPSLPALLNQYPLIENKKPKAIGRPEWINLKTERFQKNWSALSAPLEEALRETLKEKKQSLIYVHQAGRESFSVCTECRSIFRCPNCKSALRLTLKDTYQCKRCSFKSALFPSCKQCHNINFKSVGFGTEKVASEIQKKFPGARVIIADKSHLADHKKLETFYKQTEKKEPEILVTTASSLRFPPLSQLSLIAIIDADTILNLPGFRKDEQFVELLSHLHSLVPPSGRILVQSFIPESDLFQKIEKEATADILERILEERKTLRYPPYYRALTLEARPKLPHPDQALQSASRALKSLIAKNTSLKKTVLVQSVSKKERGQEKKYIIIRYLPPLPPALHEFLTLSADTFYIDHDPLSLT